MLAGLRRVEHVRRVGEDDALDPHLRDQALQLAHVGRLDPAGDDVDRFVVRLPLCSEK